MEQYNWEQLTSQQTLAAIAQAAMERSPASREKIEEVFQVLSSTLANLQGTTDELREQHDVLVDSYHDIAKYSHHYQHIFERSPQSLIVTDSNGIIQDLNCAAIKLLTNSVGSRSGSAHDGDRSRLMGQSLQSFVSSESTQVFTDYLTDVRHLSPLYQGSCQSIQVFIGPLLGERQWVNVSAQCLSVISDDCQVISWAMTDITKTRQTELALKQEIQEIHQNYADIQKTNEVLEETVQAKNSQVLKATAFESTLKRITDKVRDSLDESKILQTVVKELSIVLRLGGCNTALYDLEKGTSTIFYEYTNFISAYRGKVAQMDNFPEIYNQLKQGHYFQFCSLIPNPERGHVSLLACPIFVDSETDETDETRSQTHDSDPGERSSRSVTREKVLGDLWLIDRKEHVFNEFEIRLVQQVANQCAIAIRQARLYKAAQAQVHELEKLNRLKDEFLSTVSHELRTPISNVKMAIHMLKNAPTEGKRQQYLTILEAESQREANLIDDLLDLQKLEVSAYPISAKTLQIQPWLESIAQPFQSRMESHQQRLTIKYARSGQTLRTDFSILERIIVELLNNACKYTASGHQIQVEVYDGDDLAQIQNLSSSSVAFKVSNQADISEDELPQIFDKFYRIPHSDPWKQGGTGLGLALVEKLVDQIQGTIEVSSADGWTHFIVSIAHQT